MTTNTVPKPTNIHDEYGIDQNSNKKILQTPLDAQNGLSIKSEKEYNQVSSYQENASETKDAATESSVETDNVYVTAEINSMTDLPSSLQLKEQTPPKPGVIVPEYYDGKCVILRAYRCKGVNTTESSNLSGPCQILKCIFPSVEILKKLHRSNKEAKKKIDGENVHAFRLAATFPCMPAQAIRMKSEGPICKDTCPNLIISQASQTDDAITICRKPEDQGDSTQITTSISVSMKQGMEKPKTGVEISLTTIEEEPEMDDQETEKDEEEFVTVSKTEGTQYRPDSKEITEELSIESDKSQDVAVDTSDISSTDTITSTSSRKPSKGIFETGTIITNHSTTWLDRPKRRRNCGVVCAGSSESFCSNARINDNFIYCRKVAQPLTNHCTVQCEIIRSDPSSNCSTSGQLDSCESFEYCTNRSFDRGTRCCSMESNNSREPNEFRQTTDYWRSKSTRSLGSFQEAFMRHQLDRINNTHGCSIAGGSFENCVQNRSNRNNVCNRYYLNFDKAYNTIGRYCLCNNGYNIRNANTYYSAAGNQTVYHTPNSYYYSFNAWY